MSDKSDRLMMREWLAMLLMESGRLPDPRYPTTGISVTEVVKREHRWPDKPAARPLTRNEVNAALREWKRRLTAIRGGSDA